MKHVSIIYKWAIWLSYRLTIGYFLVVCIAPANAQYNNFWAFGDSIGLDFNFTPPVVSKTNINIIEGTASICDADGQLLFYSDGRTIWDRDHQVMPNGENLTGLIYHITESTTQGTLIVPIPGRASQYYVFSLGSAAFYMHLGWLYYCVVDMSLNNGKGDVIADTKAKMLGKDFGEQLMSVSGNHCNIWLVAASRLKEEIRCYSITEAGIQLDPVISPRLVRDGLHGATFGSMDIAPDRSKLVFAHSLILYDFDAETGKASNPSVLQKTDSNVVSMYGVAFSPDGTKLYATYENRLTYQFDLSAGNTQQIMASRTQLGKGGWAIKRGPDGKMYIANPSTFLSVIHKPNLAGLACTYKEKEFDLKGNRCFYGLPNAVTTVYTKNYHTVTKDTVLCADSVVFRARIQNATQYRWQDGSKGSTFTTDTSGTYWVTYQYYTTECETHTDTFRLVFRKNRRLYHAIALEGMCKADTLVVNAGRSDANNYLWENQMSGSERTIRQGGTYWVTYRIDSLCTYYADTFRVRYPDRDYTLSFTADSLVCVGDPLLFQNTSAPLFNRFQWQYGDGNGSAFHSPEHRYAAAGRYEARLTGWINEKCADSQSLFVIVDSAYALRFRSDRSIICTGEKVDFSPETDASMKTLDWQFGDEGHMKTQDSKQIQHAFSEAGTYTVLLTATNRSCPPSQFSDTIRVIAAPMIDLGVDVPLCQGGQTVKLENRMTLPPGSYHYLWNTGDSTASLVVRHHGLYTLKISSEPLGCTASETVNVYKDCYMDIPNAFSPNGDGYNDYFFPRQLLSQGQQAFRLTIMNRWGQVVFETHQKGGRGWDGRYDEQQQPQGVYIYQMETWDGSGQQQRYEGNVTLIR